MSELAFGAVVLTFISVLRALPSFLSLSFGRAATLSFYFLFKLFSFSFLTPFSSFSFYLFPQDNAKAAAASAAAAAAKKAAEDAAIAETEQREGKLARA